ncbi:MAG TPA: cation:proton antiporter [Acidimicrobiia bacterium]
MVLLAVIAVLVFAYSLASRAMERSVVSAPMLFAGAGILLGSAGAGLIEYPSLGTGAVGGFAEATLLLVLFTDAIRIDARRLRTEARLPLRLLGIGLPLTIIAGTAVALLVFKSYDLAAALVLASILTPTDAALGKPVVISEEVPVSIRQTINVESGLNDGIMLPVITAAVILLEEEAGLEDRGFISLLATEIGFGVAVGLAIGWLGGKALEWAVSRRMVEGVMRQLGTMAIGVAAYALAPMIGGNGFVAAFVAGIGFGIAAREHCEGAYDFAADEGELLTLITFFLFGLIVVEDAITNFSWASIGYAVLSLTVIRMIPVAIALIGSGVRTPTKLFIGWFGPRGLASILFGVFLLEESGVPIADSIFSVVVWTVMISIVAHGMSAMVLSREYGAWYRRSGPADMIESAEVFAHPTR